MNKEELIKDIDKMILNLLDSSDITKKGAIELRGILSLHELNIKKQDKGIEGRVFASVCMECLHHGNTFFEPPCDKCNFHNEWESNK